MPKQSKEYIEKLEGIIEFWDWEYEFEKSRSWSEVTIVAFRGRRNLANELLSLYKELHNESSEI